MLKQAAPADAPSRFREEELKEIRRAIAGGVWRGVLIAHAAIFATLLVLVSASTMMVGSELDSTYSDISAQLEDPLAP